MSEGNFFDELPDVDRRSCRLLGPTALIVQGLMGVLVISSLLYKRHREEPKRPWRIWLFDISKQVIGQMFVHGINVLISGVVAGLSFGNACVLYFLNILVDTTLGVGVIYFVLHGITYLLTEKCHFKGFESGKYGSPPSFNYWFRQAAVYLFALTTMKALVVGLFAAWPGIFKLGEKLLDFLGPSDAMQVIFTMGLFPIMMNIIQFWLIDSIVKASGNALALTAETPRGSVDEDQEPLFAADPDEDDDDGTPQRHDIENPAPRSVSRTVDPDAKLPSEESKSFGSNDTTAAGSGSVTPKAGPVDAASRPMDIHEYPPSLTSSSATTPASSLVSSFASHARSVSPHPKRRKSPPPVLPLHSTQIPTHHSIQRHDVVPAAAQQKPGPRIALQPEISSETDWAAWGESDGTDDWADRVGEEEWTGRRMEAKRETLHDVWVAHGAGELGAETLA